MFVSLTSMAFKETTAYTNWRLTHKDATFPNLGRQLTSAIHQQNNLLLLSRQQPRHSKLALTLYSTTDDSSNGGNAGSSLVRQTDNNIMKKQLLNAFTNLGTADQYDAVLTGLCAKILDDMATTTNNNNNENTPDKIIVAIQDCTDLLEEMNASKITASSRSLMALIDVSFSFLWLWFFVSS
jgi:hypothetical protein